MPNLSDTEIIKALEGKRPLGMGAIHGALDLINRLQAGKKSLEERNVILKGMVDRQQAEIERLTKANEKVIFESGHQSELWRRHYESIFETAKETVKSEAYKEIANILIDKAGNAATWTGIEPVVTISDIKSLLIEMESETNV